MFEKKFFTFTQNPVLNHPDRQPYFFTKDHIPITYTVKRGYIYLPERFLEQRLYYVNMPISNVHSTSSEFFGQVRRLVETSLDIEAPTEEEEDTFTFPTQTNLHADIRTVKCLYSLGEVLPEVGMKLAHPNEYILNLKNLPIYLQGIPVADTDKLNIISSEGLRVVGDPMGSINKFPPVERFVCIM